MIWRKVSIIKEEKTGYNKKRSIDRKRTILLFHTPEGNRTPDNAAPETAALSAELQVHYHII
jgi:hypothetical protein